MIQASRRCGCLFIFLPALLSLLHKLYISSVCVKLEVLLAPEHWRLAILVKWQVLSRFQCRVYNHHHWSQHFNTTVTEPSSVPIKYTPMCSGSKSDNSVCNDTKAHLRPTKSLSTVIITSSTGTCSQIILPKWTNKAMGKSAPWQWLELKMVTTSVSADVIHIMQHLCSPWWNCDEINTSKCPKNIENVRVKQELIF